MGCPPDPIEVSISRSSERISELESKYHRLIDEYSAAQQTAQVLISGFIPEKTAHRKEKFDLRTYVSPTEEEPYADEAAQWRMEGLYQKRVKELEDKLCLLRTQLVADVKQRKLHLAHRNEDRAQWIKWLKQRLELLEFHLNDKTADTVARVDLVKTQRMLKDIEAEIQRLEKIDDETLLSDRDILHADEQRWRTPYID